jgi:hypothetical protein
MIGNHRNAQRADFRPFAVPQFRCAGKYMIYAFRNCVSCGCTWRRCLPSGDWDPCRMRPNMLIDGGDRPVDWDNGWAAICISARMPSSTGRAHPAGMTTTLASLGLPRDPGVLKAIARVGPMHVGQVGQFACAGSYAEVVRPGVVRRGDQVRIARVQPRHGALAATIDMMAAALAAGS